MPPGGVIATGDDDVPRLLARAASQAVRVIEAKFIALEFVGFAAVEVGEDHFLQRAPARCGVEDLEIVPDRDDLASPVVVQVLAVDAVVVRPECFHRRAPADRPVRLLPDEERLPLRIRHGGAVEFELAAAVRVLEYAHATQHS
jgi:hypothetical protein